MNKNPDYSVLTYNIGGYEILHEVEEPSERAEYIYVTDDRSITSSTWNVVYVDNPHPEDPFDLCYKIRFNPFDYVHTDVVVRIDGSMIVKKPLDKIVDDFNAGNWDISLCIHPTRSVLYDEYVAWVVQRGYPVEQANKVLSFLSSMEGYDVKNYRGLYQYNFMIQRNNKANNDLNMMTLAFMRYLAPDGKCVERLDQTLGSFVLNKYFNGLNVLPVGEDLFHSEYLSWCAHGTDTPLRFEGKTSTPYLFGREITTTTF